MNNTNIPLKNDLPSMGKLIKSTILAICISTILLVTVVLPAEYGIDPTGVGSAIGLLKMGEIKVSLAQEAEADRAKEVAEKSNSIDNSMPTSESVSEEVSIQAETNIQTDEITISLAPDEGKEIKLTMAKGSIVNYLWYTDGGKANFDSHADSKKLDIKYHNYEKGQLERSEGIMEAAFDGNHGWFWRNRTSAVLTVTLEVSGVYTDVLRF